MLGDIEPELVEGNYHAARDEELAAHRNAVAGRVLMVALLCNDDKPAGLLGHELFREILGVSVVSDRKDISDKLTCMFNSIDRDTKFSRKAPQIIDRQEGIQNQADCVALYASAAAGYSPQAYAELFDRSAGTNGSSSSILTDFFGTTSSSLGAFGRLKRP